MARQGRKGVRCAGGCVGGRRAEGGGGEWEEGRETFF